MEHSTGDSGINSLGGFAYQIKVFMYYLAFLKKGEYIEFESIEDVNIRKEQLDEEGEKFKCVVKRREGNIAIQVKRTNISSKSAEKIIYNWLLLEKSSVNIDRYILFTDEEYKNENPLSKIDAELLFKKVMASNNRANALVTKVKTLFMDDLNDFKITFAQIEEKYQFKSILELDNLIEKAFEEIFRKVGVTEPVYYMRIHELLRCITTKIMESVELGKPFVYSYENFIVQVEHICENINNAHQVICYSTFKKVKGISWNDLNITTSRECMQLQACGLPRNIIEEHLIYKMYYETSRCLYMENNKVNIVDNIEDTTYENFTFAIFELKQEDIDTPFRRLKETKKATNSYTPNEQIRFGSCIYLTGENIEEERRISWKDDGDE